MPNVFPLILAQPAPVVTTSKGIDYWEVITGGGPVVVGVLVVLILASVASWGIIARKYLHLRRAHQQSVTFLETFWRSKRLDTVYQHAETLPLSPVGQVFRAGYTELAKLTAPGEDGRPAAVDADDGMENVERALRRAANAELTHLEETTPFLATTAAAAPFVGLFGTVWGIMGAFHDITMQGNASLVTVSKPIAEALIATAVGLFAAIPAVVAYNFFAARIRTMENEMQNFGSDFLNVVKRHFLKGA